MTRSRATPTHIYFLRPYGKREPIKIGCSCAPETRRRQLSADLKAKMVLLFIVPGGYVEEAQIHRQFAGSRIEGEWFQLTDELVEFMDYCAANNALPPVSEEDRERRMETLYRSGSTLQEIGDLFGITRERVRQILRRSGVESLGPRAPKRTAEERARDAEMVRAYRAGDSLMAIARRYGWSGAGVYNVLRRNGVETRSKGRHTSPRTLRRVEVVAREYAAGRKIVDIAAQIGVQPPNVYRFLALAGVNASRQPHAGKRRSRRAA